MQTSLILGSIFITTCCWRWFVCLCDFYPRNPKSWDWFRLKFWLVTWWRPNNEYNNWVTFGGGPYLDLDTVFKIFCVCYQQSSRTVGGAGWGVAWLWPNEMIKLWLHHSKMNDRILGMENLVLMCDISFFIHKQCFQICLASTHFTGP